LSENNKIVKLAIWDTAGQ